MNLDTAISLLDYYKSQKTSILEVQKAYFPNMNIQKDKGWRGKVLERMLYINNSSNLTDFADCELKSIPIEINQDGEIKIKETTCIHAIDALEMVNTEFEKSSFFQKMKNLLMVMINNADHTIFDYKLINFDEGSHQELLLEIKKDYDDLVSHILDNVSLGQSLTNNFTGHIGKYVQPRPKFYKLGGKGYAFYFKKNLLKKILNL